MSIFDDIDKLTPEQLDLLETATNAAIQHRRRRKQLSDEPAHDEADRLNFYLK